MVLVCGVAASDFVDELAVAVALHGLAHAVEVDGQRPERKF